MLYACVCVFIYLFVAAYLLCFLFAIPFFFPSIEPCRSPHVGKVTRKTGFLRRPEYRYIYVGSESIERFLFPRSHPLTHVYCPFSYYFSILSSLDFFDLLWFQRLCFTSPFLIPFPFILLSFCLIFFAF